MVVLWINDQEGFAAPSLAYQATLSAALALLRPSLPAIPISKSPSPSISFTSNPIGVSKEVMISEAINVGSAAPLFLKRTTLSPIAAEARISISPSASISSA